MKKFLAFFLIMLFGFSGLVFAQSAKEVYKAVKKAEIKSTGSQRDIDNAIADARAEVDLFKDSKEAKKNPEFSKHIESAMEALRKAQFHGEITRNSLEWQKSIDHAGRELDIAKQFLK